ncbi:helix-turn-helix domain-containing protein [Serratia fonticola]|uniref:helix-turn-helix domain-containing protein n=1 Tax=Serratia fonticola TaxID=47917 RepID=UPI00141A394C|nr:helix-turn-helix transcriptional regulator [Serratia fonticola]NXZ90114.1 helix-turn-helix transcriptional regulator [Serratia fonticola]NYA46048.1 helix-turn-helix transcriptional regulator [Serratia fonticola]
MAITITLGVLMAEKKIKSKDLALDLGITEANLSLLKNGKVKGVKFSTLERLCEILNCQPGDIIKYI